MRRVASRRDAMGSRGARYWIWAALCAVSCADVARRTNAGLVHGVDAHEHAHVRDGA